MNCLIFICFRFHKWKNDWAIKRLSSHVHASMTFESRCFIEAELWFGEMVDALSNRKPDLQRRELLACLTFKKIFEMYKELASNPLKSSQFRRMRKTKFPDVIVPKDSHRKEEIRWTKFHFVIQLSIIIEKRIS